MEHNESKTAKSFFNIKIHSPVLIHKLVIFSYNYVKMTSLEYFYFLNSEIIDL